MISCQIKAFSRSNGTAIPDIARLILYNIISFLEVGKHICGYVDIEVHLYYRIVAIS